MPDRFEDDLRDELEDLAGEAEPPAKAPGGVLRSARRRILVNSAAVVVALATLAGGVVAGVRLADHADRVPVAPSVGPPTTAPSPSGTSGPSPSVSGSPTSGPSPTPTTGPEPSAPAGAGGTGPGPLTRMLFVDGIVYRYAEGGDGLAAAVVGRIPEHTALQPPVDTPFGVLVLGDESDADPHLWLLGTDGTRRLIAANTDGFAVSADGTRVAYARLGPGSSPSFLVERHLDATDAQAGALRVDTFVRAIGYAGGLVVLETGDGAAATAATWVPGATGIHPIEGYGTVVATDPAHGLAVVNEGDGPCWDVLRLAVDAPAVRVKRGECNPFVGVSFDPSGAAFAGVYLRSPTRTGTHIILLAGVHSALGGALDAKGSFQAEWTSRNDFLVMSEPNPGELAVTACRISENMCPDPPLWRGHASGDEGAAWIVEERAFGV
jgi:hypothetical protein